jgi:hypothetical protein
VSRRTDDARKPGSFVNEPMAGLRRSQGPGTPGGDRCCGNLGGGGAFHEPARQHEGRTGPAERWAKLTDQLREDDEDGRPAETAGWADSGEPATYPPLAVVPQPPDPPPPHYNDPTRKSHT